VDVWRLIRFVEWAKSGAFPNADGTLDQTAYFMSAYDLVTSEQARIKNELGCFDDTA
jgi:hypothetical protein